MGHMGSSIGHIGAEPVLASSERLRGFLTGVLRRTDLEEFRRRVEEATARVLAGGSSPTRLSLRVVAEDDVLGELPALEAAIPLGAGRSLVYLGVNAGARALSASESALLDDQRRFAAGHFGAGGGPDVTKLARRLERAKEKGYSVSVIDRLEGRAALAASDLPTIASLLLAFGYDKDDAATILEDRSNLIGVVRHGEDVVGFGIAETAEVPLTGDGHVLRIAELTDSIVDDRHTGNGLQTLIHLRLMDALLARSTRPDLIFSESTYGGSLFNAATLGRHFAGRLANHAIIDTGHLVAEGEPPRYQSLEVTYTTATEAAELLEELRPVLDATAK